MTVEDCSRYLALYVGFDLENFEACGNSTSLDLAMQIGTGLDVQVV